VTRKEAQQILRGLGVENRFTLRMVNFEWASRQVLSIKRWHPDPKANEIKAAFRDTDVVVEFDVVQPSGQTVCIY